MSDQADLILARSHRLLVGVAALQSIVCLAMLGVVLGRDQAPPVVHAPAPAVAAAPADCECPTVAAVAPAVDVAPTPEPTPAPPVAAPVAVVSAASPAVIAPVAPPPVRPPAVVAPPTPDPVPEPEAKADGVADAELRIDASEPFTSVEVICRSGYRDRALFVKGVALVPAVPSTEDCVVAFKGGPPARNVIRGGQSKRCTFDNGQAICR